MRYLLDDGEEVQGEGSSLYSEEIWVHQFSEDSAQKFREQVMMRAKKNPMLLIPIYIDSYGGNADSLAKMLETMDEVPNRFMTIVSGKAASCGAILLSHGDIRFCGKFSRIMVHNVSGMSWGDTYSLKASSDESMRMNKVFMGLLAKNCGMSYEELQVKIKNSIDSKEIWMDASQALDFGIIDEVGTPEIIPVIQWAYNVVPPKSSMEEDMAAQMEEYEEQIKQEEKKKKPKKTTKRSK